MRDVVAAVAAELTIPFAVGGGVSTPDDVRALLRAGCDKVSLNSAAVRDPAVLREAADEFGSQCIVLAIDAQRDADGGGFEVVVDGGRTPTGRDAVAWAARSGGARRGRDLAHEHRSRRHEIGLRSRAHARGARRRGRAGDRIGRRRMRRRFRRRFLKRTPMRRSPRRSFISANSTSARSKTISRRAGVVPFDRSQEAAHDRSTTSPGADGGLVTGRRAETRGRGGPDARLRESRSARTHARGARRRSSTVVRAQRSGARARPRVTCSASRASRSIAMATRCSIASIRVGSRLPHGRDARASRERCSRAPATSRRRAAHASNARSRTCARRSPRAVARTPKTSYTAQLLRDGVDRIGKKIGEEATEVVIAAKNGDASGDRLGSRRPACITRSSCSKSAACRSTTSARSCYGARRSDAPHRASLALTDLAGVGPQLARKFACARYSQRRAISPRRIRATITIGARRRRSRRSCAPRAARAHGAGGSRFGEEIAVGRIVQVSEFRARVPLVAATIDDGTGRLKATWFGRRGLVARTGPADLRARPRARSNVRAAASHVELNVLHHRVLGRTKRTRARSCRSIARAKTCRRARSRRRSSATSKRSRRSCATTFRATCSPRAATRRRATPGATRIAPATPEAAAAARERLIYDEFFGIALAAAAKRARAPRGRRRAALHRGAGLARAFAASLPFAPTGAQRRVIAQIWADMAGTAPMNRLVQGDVGSGKTLVAAAAIVLAAACGVQSALMAPTEILASQHARKLAPLLLRFGIRVDALVRQHGRARAGPRRATATRERRMRSRRRHARADRRWRRRSATSGSRSSTNNIASASRNARSCARRAARRTRSHMTATPIPRTLAQTKYADLDLSIIDELPPGRTPIETYVVRESRKALRLRFRPSRTSRAAARPTSSRPRSTNPRAALTSALAEFERLRRGVFPELRVGALARPAAGA